MSIQSEIDRISNNVNNAIQAVEAKGVSVPEGANSDNLPELINEIFVGYKDAVRYSAQSLTDAQKSQARENIGAVSETELSTEVTTQFAGAKEEIIAEVILAIGTPLAGIVDENNNIILNGELPDGTYTLKYYNQGEYIEIGTLVVSGGTGETAPDTTLVWEKGLKIDSSTGAETTGNTVYSASNYIEIVEGYTYTINKITTRPESVKVCYYDANKTFISTSGDVIGQTENQISATVPLIDGAAYFRIRLYGTVAKLEDGDFTLTAEVSI